MTVSKQVEVEISRLYFAEHWRVGTIATQLGVHADVVRRVVGLLEPRKPSPPRPKLVDSYREYIGEILERYPRLCSTRLYDMLRDRGYEGSGRTLRRYVATVRPAPKREAFLRVEPLVGEQAQVDWAHVGSVRVPGGTRALWLFVMVLSWSRALWGEFVLSLTVNSLLRSLSRAAEYFGGTTRQWLFDNPKTIVLGRHGDAVRFHPLLLDHAATYRAQPQLCAVRKANQKGKVERAIRYLRDRFLAGRTIHTREQGNALLAEFIESITLERRHPTRPGVTVRDCLNEERARLLPLPEPPPSCNRVLPVKIDKTAFARFETNRYSLPPAMACRTLSLIVDDERLRFVDNQTPVASHQRCWGKQRVIENPRHRQQLIEEKTAAAAPKGQDRLRTVVPNIDVLFERWLGAGKNIGSMTARTVKLLDLYGDDLFAAAAAQVIARGTHDPGALAILCEQARAAQKRPVPIDVTLSDSVPDKDVIPHSLESYDEKTSRRD